MSKKSICFVANYEKTLLFEKVANKLVDFNIFWVTVNKALYKHLLKNYPEKTVLLIDKDSILEINDSTFSTSKYKLNEIWIGDRVLKHEKWGQKYLSNLSGVYYNFISKNNIDFIFGEQTWAHELLINRISYLNEELNCKCLSMDAIRMPGGRFSFFQDEYGLEFLTPFPSENEWEDKPLLEPKKPDYLALNDKLQDERSRLPFFIDKLKYFFTERIHESHDPTKPDSYWRAFTGFLKYYINKNQYAWFVKELQKKDLENKKFVLFTLHKQPESSIDNSGRYYENQHEIIKNIWRIIPEDTLLIVKEHSNAIGDRNLAYYNEISKYKNVEFINYKEDSYSLIKMAQAVFTISGTVAYEAPLMNTPSFTFIPIFFNNLSLSRHINFDILRDPKTCLDSLINSVKYNKENDQKYTNWIYANSFEGIISDYISNPKCMEDENVDNLVNAIKIIISK